MSHKVHPKSYRIRNIGDWESRGFYWRKFSQYLKEDFEIRKFLANKLTQMGVARIEIERFPQKTNIIISSSRPGLIIGRGGEGVERVKKELIKIMTKKFPQKTDQNQINLEIKEIKNPWISAVLASDWIVQQIQRRVRFKKAMKQALEKVIGNKEVMGARIELTGRLDGAEIARREWTQKGQLPRQTIRADIDYYQNTAHCSYGAVGVKVWIYKGEKFE